MIRFWNVNVLSKLMLLKKQSGRPKVDDKNKMQNTSSLYLSHHKFICPRRELYMDHCHQRDQQEGIKQQSFSQIIIIIIIIITINAQHWPFFLMCPFNKCIQRSLRNIYYFFDCRCQIPINIKKFSQLSRFKTILKTSISNI